MQPFLLIATVSMISEKLFFPISMATIDGKTSYFLKTIQAYQSKLFLDKWSQTDKEYPRKVVVKVYPLPHY